MVSYATTSLYHNLSRDARPPARHVDARQWSAWLVSHRTDMVRRLAAVAEKPQCSGTTPPLMKDLTDARHARTFPPSTGCSQERSREARPLSMPPDTRRSGSAGRLQSHHRERRTPCDSALITAPPVPSWPRSIGVTTRWSVF